VQGGLLVAAGVSLLSHQAFDDGFPLITVATVVGATVGALIVARDPSNRVGWLLCLGQFAAAVGLAAGTYSDLVLRGQLAGSDDLGHYAGWLGRVFSAPFAISLLALLLLLVPNGRLPSRRWRPILWGLVLGLVLYVAAFLLTPPSKIQAGRVDDPGLLPNLLAGVGLVLTVIGVAGSALALVRRLRQARGAERQQLRLIGAAATLLAGGVAVAIVASLASGGSNSNPPLVLQLPLFLGYLSVPLATGVAVLRYRLYDVDLIISRAVVVGVVAVFVTVGYVTVVVLVGALVGSRADDLFWPSLLATVVVAIAFQPLRRSVHELADRLAYGERAAPYEALADLSHQLESRLTTDELLPAVAEAAGHVARARCCRVGLLVDGSPTAGVVWPPSVAEPLAYDVRLLVRHGSDEVGAIEIGLEPGDSVGRRERNLLDDLGRHCAVAFHNAKLGAALEAESQQLARDAQSLAASRRRLVLATQAERRRLARAINREVLPHLAPTPARIAEVGMSLSDSGVAAAHQLGELESSTTHALDALRRISRGVFPAVLARRGLVAALREHVEQQEVPAHLVVDPALEHLRFDARVETATYFCCRDVLHDLVSPDRITLWLTEDRQLRVCMEGEEPPEPVPDSDLALVRDRAESLGGRADVARVGVRVTVTALIPVIDAAPVAVVGAR
jgi:signal transduction histidine kinase